MKQSDHGRDSRSVEVIHELDVELQAFLIDGIIPTAEGYDAGPMVASSRD
jgi:hypothetical protein